MHASFTVLDAVVLVACVVGVTTLGLWLGGRQRGARDYFLAGRDVPHPRHLVPRFSFIGAPITVMTGRISATTAAGPDVRRH